MATETNGTFYPEYCVMCSKAIEVVTPTWYRLEWDLANLGVRWSYHPDHTALCVACSLASALESERPALETHLAWLMERKMATGLRDDVTMFHHRDNNEHVYGRVRGVFHQDLYFIHMRGALPDDCVLPRVTITADGMLPLTLLYVGWDFVLEGVPAIARFTWDITDVRKEGELRIDGWSQATHPGLMRLMEGARALMRASAVGRPRGTTDLDYDDYVASFRIAEAALGHPPKTWDEFLGTTDLSGDTFKRHLKRWGITWRAFKAAQSSR